MTGECNLAGWTRTSNREDVQLQLPGWRREVNPLPQRDKPHAEGLELVQERHQVLEAPAQAIEPANQDVEPTAPRAAGD